MKIRNDFTFLGALNASSNVNFSTREQGSATMCENKDWKLRIQN